MCNFVVSGVQVFLRTPIVLRCLRKALGRRLAVCKFVVLGVCCLYVCGFCVLVVIVFGFYRFRVFVVVVVVVLCFCVFVVSVFGCC